MLDTHDLKEMTEYRQTGWREKEKKRRRKEKRKEKKKKKRRKKTNRRHHRCLASEKIRKTESPEFETLPAGTPPKQSSPSIAWRRKAYV